MKCSTSKYFLPMLYINALSIIRATSICSLINTSVISEITTTKPLSKLWSWMHEHLSFQSALLRAISSVKFTIVICFLTASTSSFRPPISSSSVVVAPLNFVLLLIQTLIHLCSSCPIHLNWFPLFNTQLYLHLASYECTHFSSSLLNYSHSTFSFWLCFIFATKFPTAQHSDA